MNRDSPRRELKFVARRTCYHQLLQWLREQAACFQAPFPGRWVNNIYFDTFDCRGFSESLYGASARFKVRYRWYGESKAPQAGNLEIKFKRNCLGWKSIFEIRQTPYRPGASWSRIRKAMIEQLPAEGKQWLYAHPAPVLINRYFRQYFQSRDSRIRVTVDSRQSMLGQSRQLVPNLHHPEPIPDLVIVEFKFAPQERAAASRTLQGFPLRPGRYSKYVTGARTIYGL